MFEYYTFANAFKRFEDRDFRFYALTLLLGLEDVGLEETLTIL